jgi:hypothetical protein
VCLDDFGTVDNATGYEQPHVSVFEVVVTHGFVQVRHAFEHYTTHERGDVDAK